MRKISFLFVVLSTFAHAMLVDPNAINAALESSVLVAEIQGIQLKTYPDPVHHARFESTVRLSRIVRKSDDGGWFPSVGDLFAITGLGGERDGIGVTLTGHPKPYVGKKYLAYLIRSSAKTFSTTGMESGLRPLGEERAYSRNRTDGSNGQGSGPFLYWDSGFFPLAYFISYPSFKNHPEYVTAIDQSFATWRDPSDIRLEFVGLGCSMNTRNENDGINTVIYVEQDWPFDATAIAITRNYYVAGTSARAGLILDSDILLNGVHHEFSITGEAGKHDVQNIVTHEVGHFIGLGHEVDPSDPDAAMFFVAATGETKKRTLHASDLEGLRAAYRGIGPKVITPQPSCLMAPQTASCASVHHGGGSPRSLVLMTLYLILILLIGRWMVGRRSL